MEPLAADFALFLRCGVCRVEKRLAVHENFTLVGRRQEIEAAQKRRLTAAGRADDRHGLALFQRKVDAAQHDGVFVKRFADALHFQYSHVAPPYALK